jgi:salicylate hydroxylase
MVGDGAPRIAGHTTYRSVIPTEQMPEYLRWNAATLWAGARCHLVHYPLSGWKVFNLAITCHNDPAEAFAARPVTHDEVLEGFRDVHPHAKAIIHHGKGDAAHPMLQYFAQGACMALEDAVALAEELDAAEDDPAHALERYRNIRLLRTARVQLGARELGDHVYHPSGVHALLRNQLIRETSLERFCENLAWLYQDPFSERPSDTTRMLARA